MDIPFPMSSQPGAQPGEGQGRLLNRYYERDDQISQWKLVPGLLPFTDVSVAGPRGALDVAGTLYVARTDTALTVSKVGAVSTLVGALPGSDVVTWARNNAVPPQIVAVCQAGAFLVDPTSGVQPYPDGSLPDVNSVSMLDGYFLFTQSDGHVWASGVNDIWVEDPATDPGHLQNALAFAMCDMSGGLVRGTAWAQQFFAFGRKACTVFTNAGTSPWPMARTSIIPVGLIGPSAVAGFEPGWGLAQYFVATDATVRRLDGYVATIISNRDVERAIAAVSDPDQIVMGCYVAGGRPVIFINMPGATWEHNAQSGHWNERASFNQSRWRSARTVYFADKWLAGDILSTRLNQISATAYDELGQAMTARLESGPIKSYPQRLRINAAYFDFTSGQGAISGNPDAVNPEVWISTSGDGGGVWSQPVVRRTLGAQGQFSRMVRVNRLGIATQHGMRFRVDTSSPVYSSFRGARADGTPLGAP